MGWGNDLLNKTKQNAFQWFTEISQNPIKFYIVEIKSGNGFKNVTMCKAVFSLNGKTLEKNV